jgi:hypothetical protein
MQENILFLMSVWGATHVIVSSKIMSPIRNMLIVRAPKIGDVLNCYQCTGFWVSVIFYVFFDLPTLTREFYWCNLDLLFWGFIGSGFCSLLSFMSSYLLRNKDI